MIDDKEWYYGSDEEIFSGGPLNNRSDAIEECIQECDPDVGDNIFVGTKGEFIPVVYAHAVIESVQEDAYEFCPAAEGWLNDVTQEQQDQLSRKLNDVFHEWLSENSLHPNFFPIEGVERIEVTKDLLDSFLNKEPNK